MSKFQKTLLVIIPLLIILNLTYLDYHLFLKKPPLLPTQSPVSPLPQNSPTPTPKTPTPTPTPTSIPQFTSLPQTTPTPQVNYIPLGGAPTSTTNTTWTLVSGSEFTLDPADYPAKAKIYWQANLKISDPGSRCYARIYDTTHSRAVDFSEQSTDQTSHQTLTSQPLAIWSGNNHHRLEIKSLNGFTCSLDSPKLIIKY